MFCYQCEQTARGEGCTVGGVCGKDPATAAMQDLLVYVSKGVARYVVLAERMDVDHRDADRFVVEALFTTITNVNFDVEVVESLVRKGSDVRERLRQAYEEACRDAGKEPWRPEGPAAWQPPESREDMMAEAAAIGLQERMAHEGRDITGLKELITYGLKGSAAYLDHARILGREDPDLYLFISDTLAYITEDHTAEELFAKALEVGEKNLKVMELLDAANTGTYGHPEPTGVRVTPVKGKAIVVSGHDLRDLAELLAQTEGTGINVYTHGEMLPCNAYPELKKYDHLVGNYGGAWQDQQKE
ncbi:MAG: hydroxylamine reductase, partial [Candidatus Fermentibacterota bacterium]